MGASLEELAEHDPTVAAIRFTLYGGMRIVDLGGLLY